MSLEHALRALRKVLPSTYRSTVGGPLYDAVLRGIATVLDGTPQLASLQEQLRTTLGDSEVVIEGDLTLERFITTARSYMLQGATASAILNIVRLLDPKATMSVGDLSFRVYTDAQSFLNVSRLLRVIAPVHVQYSVSVLVWDLRPQSSEVSKMHSSWRLTDDFRTTGTGLREGRGVRV